MSINIPPTSSPKAATDPLPQDRHWRAAVLWTVHDLHNSIARRRILSLPNLCRLFDLRWQATQPSPELAPRGQQLGRAFLRSYYQSTTHIPSCKSLIISHTS